MCIRDSSSEQTNSSDIAPPTKVSDIKIDDQNNALNALVTFLNIAQRRGAFSMDESAKIWEAIQFFMPPPNENN